VCILQDTSEVKKPFGRHGYKNNIKIGHRSSILLSFIASRPIVGPTQCPVQRVSEALSQGVKRQGHEEYLHLVLGLRMAEVYLHAPYAFMTWCLIN
jgi:hypothetical protein